MTDADILREARERFQSGWDYDYNNRERDRLDRKFYKGGEDQWEASVRTERANRPTITVNRLPQFVKQITGDMRQNKPAIKVLPVDDQTDPKLAEVYSAIVRHIESVSDAHRIYSKAAEQAVIGGIGWFRILTDYLEDTSFEQEIVVKPIRNPLSVVTDPDAQELTRQDMMWAFVTEEVSEAKFKKTHPDAKLTGWDIDDRTLENWRRGEFIRVAEYWCRKPVKRTLALLDDGSTRFIENEDAELLAAAGIAISRTREVDSYTVHWYRMTGVEIIDQGEWKGRWIPLVPVIGEEIEVDDEVFRHGLIHHAKDAQRSYNYARSAMLEHIGSQPKAPFLATATQIKNYKSMWEGLNTGNPPVLLYDPDPQAPGAPQRVAPPTTPTAWYQEAQIADQDMKATTGIYDASLGKQSNETSGVAIRQREAQGDTATFVYIDNRSAAIRHAGNILIDLIPHIYSDERVIRMVGEDGTIEEYARINSRLPDGRTFNDISVGKYDVEVTTGPAYATKRQEAAESMLQFVQAVPAAGQIAADLIAKSMDWPNADKLAERLAKILPPGIDRKIDEQRQQEQGGQQQQPNPAEMAQMQAMQLDLQTKAAQAQKAEADAQKAQAEAAMAIQQAQAGPGINEGQAKLEMMQAEMATRVQMDREKMQHDMQLAHQRQQFDFQMMDRKAGLEEQMASRRAEREDFTASHKAANSNPAGDKPDRQG